MAGNEKAPSVKAVILCGGQGTRIRDVSDVVPKPMLPIGGRPILWHIMKLYAHHGVRDFVLCLGYKGWSIKEFFLQYEAMTSDLTVHVGAKTVEYHGSTAETGWRVTLAETGDAAQTGARIWNARRYLEDCPRFCLTYGDGVADLDVTALLKAHETSGLAGMLSGVRPAGRFGEIEFEGSKVVQFHEKPNTTGGYINGGFMVFDTKKALPYFRPGADLNLEQEVMPAMVRDGQLGVFPHDGYWQCMDTLREFNMLNDLWAKGNAPWKVW
jgi:glucose-1-phosphate cytidylyltransferase